MKKKTISLLTLSVIIVLLALLFNACGNTSAEDNTVVEPTQTDVYTQLNAMIKTVGYPVTLTSRTTESGYVYNGTYTITENAGAYEVDYSYEKLSTFGITEAGEIVVPDGFKTTCAGSMTVSGGKIVEQNGEEANIPVEALDVKGITLSETALSGVRSTNGAFTANVSSLQTVAGLNVSANAATISIEYTETKITRMTLAYSTASYQTEIVYTFR